MGFLVSRVKNIYQNFGFKENIYRNLGFLVSRVKKNYQKFWILVSQVKKIIKIWVFWFPRSKKLSQFWFLNWKWVKIWSSGFWGQTIVNILVVRSTFFKIFGFFSFLRSKNCQNFGFFDYSGQKNVKILVLRSKFWFFCFSGQKNSQNFAFRSKFVKILLLS